MCPEWMMRRRIAQVCCRDAKPRWAHGESQFEQMLQNANEHLRQNWGHCTPLMKNMVNAMYRARRDGQCRIPDAHMQAFLTEVRYFLEDFLVDMEEVARWWQMKWAHCSMFPTPCHEFCVRGRCQKGAQCCNVHPVTQTLGVGQRPTWRRFRGHKRQYPDDIFYIKGWERFIDEAGQAEHAATALLTRDHQLIVALPPVRLR